jgi:hypothetical protein
MKNLSLFICTALVILLTSCGEDIAKPKTEDKVQKQVPVEITAEEEKIITELLEEVTGEIDSSELQKNNNLESLTD